MRQSSWTAVAETIALFLLGCSMSGVPPAAGARSNVLSADPAARFSVINEEFVPDHSHPALGEAYRDPSNLIWGESINLVNEPEASRLCRSLGARLPTADEFMRLARYLGMGSPQGYSPYLQDGRTDLLPELASRLFWTSTLDPANPGYGWAFQGQTGQLSDLGESLSEATAWVRCVSAEY